MDEIVVHVLRVEIPAMSTVGYGEGYALGPDDACQMILVRFVGDHREMRVIGEALSVLDEPPLASVPISAITQVQPVQEVLA